MPALIITRGLPGSGKSTCAHRWVAGDRAGRARVNRDGLRDMLDNGIWVEGVTERRVVIARDAAITALLTAGLDVICDDTNLPQETARDLARLAREAGAALKVHDLTHVELGECIARDAARTDKYPVGEAVIREMHALHIAGRELPLPLPPGGAPWDMDDRGDALGELVRLAEEMGLYGEPLRVCVTHARVSVCRNGPECSWSAERDVVERVMRAQVRRGGAAGQ